MVTLSFGPHPLQRQVPLTTRIKGNPQSRRKIRICMHTTNRINIPTLQWLINLAKSRIDVYRTQQCNQLIEVGMVLRNERLYAANSDNRLT